MSIFAAPLGPPFTGAPPEMFRSPSGAQNQECLGAVPSGPTGGLSGRKIGAAAVSHLRLALPSQRYRFVFGCRGGPMWPPGPRAGQCPAPTERPESSLYFVGAGVLTRPPTP